ncbi:DUF4097 family beta strand repeat-containing protein [Natronoglycomyces albus]|uniref:DUF4097 family beta strand repeat protein n=1 Tax=Natronoglycomyces albus TaxID=2811108 RepID=A0A895XQC2_9ACTN|nr:DUF4097 family beta strand repeat-containing protein [Natronoglycomyces albus]QSB05569.1 DUF4097 family beta strand repeat protein [Natronoglycomyces albus]
MSYPNTTTDAQKPSPPSPFAQAMGNAVRVLIAFIAALALVGGLLVAVYYFARDIEENAASYPASDEVVLDIDNGNVNITVGDTDEIVVEREVLTVFVEPTYREDHSPEKLHVTMEGCRFMWMVVGPDCRVSYDITVPEGTAVSGHVSHGRVQIRDTNAPIDISVRHGRLDISGATGEVRAESAHGQVDISQIEGDVWAYSRHGKITINNVEGNVEAESNHGNLAITGTTGAIHAVTRHGRLHIDGGSEELYARTNHGNIEVANTSADTITLDTNHGGIELDVATLPTSAKLTTNHGDVVVFIPNHNTPINFSSNTNHGDVNIEVATSAPSRHHFEAITNHGDIDVFYR